ncbi:MULTISPECIES: hypothetical protein [Rhodonellum]|nr:MULTISPECIES: hypothetical protein [Rhodonellum]MDO9554800.1 hypothetical protein [Rhodonellum sp.]SDY84272.1 hypothetical protein SAMN05444412_103110 [Rhodonellum ikkaensis]
MKANFLKMVFVGAVALGTMISCENSTEKKIEKAEQNLADEKMDVAEAKQDLETARMDSGEFLDLKSKWDNRINENELKIAELKVKAKDQKTEVRKEYEKQLDNLQAENARINNQILNYRVDNGQNLKAFKISLDQDLDKLEKSIAAISKR